MGGVEGCTAAPSCCPLARGTAAGTSCPWRRGGSSASGQRALRRLLTVALATAAEGSVGFGGLRGHAAAADSVAKTTEPNAAWVEFHPVDGGNRRACRGAHASDDSAAYHLDHTGIPSLSQCKVLCLSAPVCLAIDWGPNDEVCRVWSRSVGSSTLAEGRVCLRHGTRSPLPGNRLYMNNRTVPQTYRPGFRYPRDDARLHNGDEVQLASTSHRTWLTLQWDADGRRALWQTRDPHKAAVFVVERKDVQSPAVSLKCMHEGQGYYVAVSRDGKVGCFSSLPMLFTYNRIDGQKWWDSAKGAFQDPSTKQYLRMEDPDLAQGEVTATGEEPSGWQLFNVFLVGGYETVYPLVRGVNLGNWFLLERWMSASLFVDENGTEVTESCKAIDEYGLMKMLPDKVREERMETHWSSWITEADIKFLANAGINTVRVPFGYWMTHPRFPFIGGQFKYLVRLFEWCEHYSIAVLLDFHGLMGSQNGDITSGNCGACGIQDCGETWQGWLMPKERATNLAVIANVSKHFAGSPVFLGLSVANEVSLRDSHSALPFYQEAYNIVRKYSADALVVLSSSFNPSTYPFKAELGMIQDEHMYFSVFTDSAVQDQQENKAMAAKYLQSRTRWQILVGEWSMEHNGYEETNSVSKQWYKEFALAQLQAFEQHSMGWIYWTYKIESPNSTWSFRDMCNEGMLPGCIPGFDYAPADWWSHHPQTFAYLDRKNLPSLPLDWKPSRRASEYFAAQEGRNKCPENTVQLSEVECREMPLLLGGALNDPFVVNESDDPKGCFKFLNNFFFNTHPSGSDRPERTPHCRLTCPLEFVPSRRDVYTCPPGAVPLTVDECRFAPQEFGGSRASPLEIKSDTDPTGCFKFLSLFYYNLKANAIGRPGREMFCRRLCSAQYVPAPVSSNHCPTGTEELSEGECYAVPRQYGELRASFVESDQHDPRGCFRFGDKGFFFNRDSMGSCRHERTPMCRLAVRLRVVASDPDTNGCPDGTVALSQSECRMIREEYGGRLNVPFMVNYASDPRGCFKFSFYGDVYFYNVHPHGSGRSGRTSFCKRTYDPDLVVGSAGAPGCLEGAAPLTQQECLGVREKLGGPLGHPFSVTSAVDPPGCFRFREFGYHYNVHPTGVGRNGRTPYCKRNFVVDYVEATSGADQCPEGMALLTELECRSLDRVFNKAWDLHNPFVVNFSSDPRGCFGFNGERYFNVHPKGRGRPERRLYCRRLRSSALAASLPSSPELGGSEILWS